MGIRNGIGVTSPITDGGSGPNITIGRINTGGSSYSGSSHSHRHSDADVLSGLIQKMYNRFKPEEITYVAKSEEEIRSSIAAWLRPGYDQAIVKRQEQTLSNKANLDADAIARGMGASTYVTDVKNRQQNAESRDIATMESDYGSTLAHNVSDGVEDEANRALQVEEFNAQQRQAAYEMAYAAAVALFQEYKN